MKKHLKKKIIYLKLLFNKSLSEMSQDYHNVFCP